MNDSLPSLITLSSLIISAALFAWFTLDKTVQGYIFAVLKGGFSMLVGFLITALVMRSLGGIDSPLVTSLMVLITSLIVTTTAITLKRKRTQKT